MAASSPTVTASSPGIAPNNPRANAQANTPAGGGTTLLDFLRKLNADIGVASSEEVLRFETAWSNFEFPSGPASAGANYNPFASIQTEPGSHAINQQGVQGYATPETGLAATEQTLKGYPAIVGLLKSGHPATAWTGQPFNPSAAFSSAPFIHDFGVWAGGGNRPESQIQAQGQQYLAGVQSRYYGPQGSAADIGSVDIGTAGHAVASAAGAIVSPITSVAHAIGWAFSNWARILEVIAGAILVLVGLVFLGITSARGTPAPARAVARGAR